jgi:hypothetical protein
MVRKLSFLVCLLFVFSVVASPALAAKKNRLTDSDEYKEDDFDKGIIEDYSDMVEGDGVEWVYLAPGFKFGDYSIRVSDWKNKSEVGAKSMMTAVEEAFDEQIKDRLDGGKKGTLTVNGCVYWAERQSEGKRWIPYAGGHLAQAGVGVEMVFRDGKGNILAKIRHSAREGDRMEYAAEEVADDVVGFMEDH